MKTSKLISVLFSFLMLFVFTGGLSAMEKEDPIVIIRNEMHKEDPIVIIRSNIEKEDPIVIIRSKID